MRLDDKVALVTGAAMGIGEAIARRFVEAGARVAMFDIDGAALHEAAKGLRAAGDALAIVGDVSSDADTLAAVKQTLNEFGRIDILVNNAGIDLSGAVTEFSPEDWDRLLGVNLKGAYLFARHAIPFMRGRGGTIVNISSVHALVSFAGSPAYDAAKAGLLALTRTLAVDHGPDGIRANAICPGYIDTPMTRKWFDSLPDRDAVMRQVEGYHPVGRIGRPADVAEAALFMASDASAFITGASLVVDGGLTIYGR